MRKSLDWADNQGADLHHTYFSTDGGPGRFREVVCKANKVTPRSWSYVRMTAAKTDGGYHRSREESEVR